MQKQKADFNFCNSQVSMAYFLFFPQCTAPVYCIDNVSYKECEMVYWFRDFVPVL